jgi:hypothetical protein
MLFMKKNDFLYLPVQRMSMCASNRPTFFLIDIPFHQTTYYPNATGK